MKKLLSCLFAALFGLSSCNKDDVIEVDSQTAPRITLDSENAVYTIKSGRELTISPTYENADKALYVWKIDGKVVGTQPALTVCEQTVGELFVLLQVSNRYGTASEELRVDVVELEIPTISLPVPEKGYTILVGSPLTLKPSVIDTSIPTTCTWSVNGKEVSSEKEFTFDTSEAGDYTLEFATRNEDGEDSKEFGVKVCTIDEMPFGWTFDQPIRRPPHPSDAFRHYQCVRCQLYLVGKRQTGATVLRSGIYFLRIGRRNVHGQSRNEKLISDGSSGIDRQCLPRRRPILPCRISGKQQGLEQGLRVPCRSRTIRQRTL